MRNDKYHATRYVEIVLDGNSVEIEADLEFRAISASSGFFDHRTGAGEPPHGGGVEDVTVKAIKFAGKVVEAPGWLLDWIAENADRDSLNEAAADADAYERDRAADYRFEEMRDERRHFDAYAGLNDF